MEWTFRADAPLYTQLCEQLTFAVVSGVFAAGERLPAVRELAVDAGVNPNTVQRALGELERGGLVYTLRTAGRFVTADKARLEAARRALAEARAGEFLRVMEKLGYDRAQAAALLEEREGDEAT
ncbi:MAG: GntR family transcriptional regulator [Oscillospiraceae bacterium]|nr:GntR family transcriptional regulator [Oscillospiraceae bacterium]